MDPDRPADAGQPAGAAPAPGSAEPTVVHRRPETPDGGGAPEPVSTELQAEPDGATEVLRTPQPVPGATEVIRAPQLPAQLPPPAIPNPGYRAPAPNPGFGATVPTPAYPQQPPAAQPPTAQWGPAQQSGPGYGAPYQSQQPAGMPQYGQQPRPTQMFDPVPVGPPGGAEQPRKRGRLIALIVAGVVLLAAAGVGGWLLLRPRYVDPVLAQAEVVAATQKTDELAATDVTCPDDAVQEQGGTFTCTATVVGKKISYQVTQSDDTGKVFTVAYDRPVLDPTAVADQIVSSTRTEYGVAPTDVQCPKDVHYDKAATFTCTAKLENQALNYVLTQTDGLGAVSIAHGRVLKMSELTAQVGGELTKGAGVPVVAECGAPGQTLLVNEPDTRIECRAWATANPGRVIPIPVKVDRSGTAYPADPVR